MNIKMDVSLNKKCFRHLTNRIQSKTHRIRTYQFNKVYLSWFVDKIYVPDNGIDALTLDY